jgi:hypothetical protein
VDPDRSGWIPIVLVERDRSGWIPIVLGIEIAPACVFGNGSFVDRPTFFDNLTSK